MNTLPNDAAQDQSGCPDGHYRRSNGMIVVTPAEQETTQSPLDLAATKIPLKKRTANEMREAASERLDLALTAVEAILRDPIARHSDKMAAAVFIRDTSHGKPTERVEHSIDLMTLILGANKREQLQSGGINGGILPAVIIDNNDKLNT